MSKANIRFRVKHVSEILEVNGEVSINGPFLIINEEGGVQLIIPYQDLIVMRVFQNKENQ